jgi:DNA-binding response OmpR family regulator
MRTPKILIIDDEVDFVKLLRFRLEANGCFVISAYNGEAGLEEAKRNKPDLILLDILLPKLDGYSVLKKIKDDTSISNIPIIMLTCMQKKEGIEDISGYVIKPYNKEDLLSAIKDSICK